MPADWEARIGRRGVFLETVAAQDARIRTAKYYRVGGATLTCVSASALIVAKPFVPPRPRLVRIRRWRARGAPRTDRAARISACRNTRGQTTGCSSCYRIGCLRRLAANSNRGRGTLRLLRRWLTLCAKRPYCGARLGFVRKTCSEELTHLWAGR
jgi:hypothetical protein